MADELVDEVGRESFDFSVKFFGAGVVEAARSLNLVLDILKLLLELKEVGVGLELWVSLGNGEDARESVSHLGLSFSGGLDGFSAHSRRTSSAYRISAVEQLKTYSDILELPLEIVYNPQELASALERHRDKDLILIDTAGRSQHNEYQLRELEEFLRINPRIEKHLVISATTKFTDARQIMNKFAQVEPDKIIFTKIDETSSLGMIVNLLHDKKYSLSYITTGQSVPDDIERAGSDILANFLLKKVDEL